MVFLDQILEGMIQRFENEFPECRLQQQQKKDADEAARASANQHSQDDAERHSINSNTSSDPTNSLLTGSTLNPSLENSQAIADVSDDDEGRSTLRSRHNSDVSLASRALALEEAQIHRIGQQVRRDLLRPVNAINDNDPAASSAIDDGDDAEDVTSSSPTDASHLENLRHRLEELTGEQVRKAALEGKKNNESGSWENYLKSVGLNAREILLIKKNNPEEFQQFKEAQETAIWNSGKSSSKRGSIEVNGNGVEKKR